MYTDKTISDFIMATMPIIVAGFCIIVITLLSPERWVAAILEVPVIVILVWYLWQIHLRRQLLEELAMNDDA